MDKNTSKFNEEFIKIYGQDSNKGYILEVDVDYLEYLHDLHSDLPLLAKRMKTNKCIVILYVICMIKNYIVYMKVLKKTFNHGLILKKVHRVI